MTEELSSVDDFVYTLVDELGLYHPSKICQLGGLFFRKYSQQLRPLTDDALQRYREFLHEKNSAGNRLTQPTDRLSEGQRHLHWVMSFLRQEIVALGQPPGYTSEGVHLLSSALIDGLVTLSSLQFVPPKHRQDALLARVSALPTFLDQLRDYVPSPTIPWLLEVVALLEELPKLMQWLKNHLDDSGKESLVTFEGRLDVTRQTHLLYYTDLLNRSAPMDEGTISDPSNYLRTVGYLTGQPDLDLAEVRQSFLGLQADLLAKVRSTLGVGQTPDQFLGYIQGVDKLDKLVGSELTAAAQEELQRILELLRKLPWFSEHLSSVPDVIVEAMPRPWSQVWFGPTYLPANKTKRRSSALYWLPPSFQVNKAVIPYYFLRDLYPGTHLLQGARHNPTYTQRILGFPTTTHAIQAFLGSLVVEEGLAVPAPTKGLLLLDHYHHIVMASTDLRLGLGEWSEVEARDHLRSTLGLKGLALVQSLEGLKLRPGLALSTWLCTSQVQQWWTTLRETLGRDTALPHLMNYLVSYHNAPPDLFLEFPRCECGKDKQ